MGNFRRLDVSIIFWICDFPGLDIWRNKASQDDYQDAFFLRIATLNPELIVLESNGGHG